MGLRELGEIEEIPSIRHYGMLINDDTDEAHLEKRSKTASTRDN